MKLCLINPPEIAGFISDRDKAGGIGVAKPFTASWRNPYLPPTPAMDLLYAAAIAEREGIDVRFLDCLGQRWDTPALLREVAAAAPTHIGVRLSLPSLDQDLAVADAIAEAHPEAKVFLFGHASQETYTRWIKGTKADRVLYGEVEALLMPYLRGEASPNLLDPKAESAVCFSWAYAEDLDHLPHPAWHLVDIPRYSPTGKVEDFVFYILTSRGCPKGCSMCPYYVHQGKQWRFRAIESVMAEFEALRGLGAVRIQTRDPNISFRKKHLIAIAERLAGEKQFKISTETDLEVLNEADLVLLKEAGFTRIMTGVESVDEAVIKDIGQNGNALKRVLDNMALCQKLGVDVTGFFIVGSLNETWKSVRDTVATAQALPCSYSVSLMTPYFGTKMRDEFVDRGYYKEADSYQRYNGYSGLVRTVGLDFDEVVVAHAWASAELELVSRRRQLKAARGLAKAKAAARLAVQTARAASLRQMAAVKERQTARPAQPQAT